jgi:hypothetical protein
VLRLHEKLGRGEARDRAIALLDRTGIPSRRAASTRTRTSSRAASASAR